MKKGITCIIFTVMCMSIVGCSKSVPPLLEHPLLGNDKPVVMSSLSSVFVTFDFLPKNLEDLEENSDAIVRTKVLPGYYNNELIFAGYSFKPYGHDMVFLKMEVLEVYKGKLKKGNIITLAEQYQIKETETEVKIEYYENYVPTLIGEEYIFFLGQPKNVEGYPKDIYYPKGIDLGRYRIIDELKPSPGDRLKLVEDMKHFTNTELNLGSLDSSKYRKMFRDVIDKYYE